ncbi:MAG: Ig-like domain-containing protein [Muribaculaceae bacterium]|nr:Ig-like domain-containing protein [Muribaculaceae bacterium]
MSGSAVANLDVTINDKTIECTGDFPIFNWVWTDETGVENVTCTWSNVNYARYIHSISVIYVPDLGGKQECDLSFGEKTVDGVLGETFSSPILSNPHDLNITWTSSDEKVATVDSDGKVTLVNNGSTVITASTEGNDEYAAGNAKYNLCVIPSASNIAELKELAPNLYERVKVNFPATVNYGSLSYAYVTDAEGNATCYNDVRNRGNSSTSATTLYKAGQVIPGGWIATNATIYESLIWEGSPDKSTETAEVTYAKVASITPADADRVVVLENVKFEKATPQGTTKAYGTTPDGTRYEFQDTFNIGSKPAGTYDVTGVVRYSKRGETEYFYMSPIKYTDSVETSVEIEEAEASSVNYYNLDGTPATQPQSGVYIKVANGKSVKIIK